MTNAQQAQETEVTAKPRRRKFAAKYKQDIVREADAAAKTGEIGALLRREGLYSSHLTSWRHEIAQRELAALAPRKRGPKGADARDVKIGDLERALAKVTQRAERAELIVGIQKKVSLLLGVTLPEPEDQD